MRRVQAAGSKLTALLFFISGSVFADQYEGAAAVYRDAERVSFLQSNEIQGTTSSLVSGEGHETTATLGYSIKKTIFEDTINNHYMINEQLNGQNHLLQHSFNAAIDQGVAVGSSVGAFGGLTKSPLGNSKWYGGRFGQWWRQDTLQTVFEARRTSATQSAAEVYDDDRRLIRLPENLDGNNFNVSVMHFTTPTLILRGQLSRTTRSDRPPADSVSSEARYFITPTNSSIHFGLSHYENVGQIERVTTYGSVVANSVQTEWHQRIGEHAILMGGYRTYQENEKPLAEVDRKHLGSDWVYANLRWRFDGGVWTSDASEIYLFGGHYTTNEPRKGDLAGFGGKITF